MKKIAIKHIPKCVDVAMVILVVMVFGASLTLRGEEKPTMSQVFYVIAVAVLFFAGVILAATVRTTVKFGEGSVIRCRWLFLFWKIDLEEVGSVTYTLQSYRSRGGGRSYCFKMFFYTAPDRCRVLKEHLNYQVAEDCIRRKYDDVQLMKLYQYIGEIMPGKGIGYE